MRQLAAKMPWSYALDDTERRASWPLLKKVVAPNPGTTDDARGRSAAAASTTSRCRPAR